MREHLAAYFESHHKLVESSALQMILASPRPLALSRALIERSGADSPFVTVEMVEALLSREAARAGAVTLAPRAAPAPPPAFALVAPGYEPPPAGRAPLQAYGELFRSRYDALAQILRGKAEIAGARPIAELRRSEGRATIIGMVRDVRRPTGRQHILLTLEDPTGSTEVFVPKDTEAARVPWLPDEVVGVVVQLPKERDRSPRAVHVVRPDVVPGRPDRGPTPDGRVLFLSDLHVGSKSFLEDEWGALIAFLHGREGPSEVAESIRHVVIAGDLVDGIGIYPNQERDLAIGDIFEQYTELGRRLRELPHRLDVVVIPGNHDAVCPAEPQPALPPEISGALPSEVHSLANPSTFALDGVVIEAYHGRSFDDLIPAIPGASYARPTEVMRQMLAMRHLAPIYGGRTPLAPLPRDGLVVDPAPEVLVTGHAHTYGVDQYHGVLLLNVSTWQAETEYQKMRNIDAVPAHAAVVRLGDLGVSTVDCTGGRVRVRTGA